MQRVDDSETLCGLIPQVVYPSGPFLLPHDGYDGALGNRSIETLHVDHAVSTFIKARLT